MVITEQLFKLIKEIFLKTIGVVFKIEGISTSIEFKLFAVSINSIISLFN